MAKYTDYLKQQKIDAANKEYIDKYSNEMALALSRLLKNKDFRFFISDLIGYTNPFQSSFDEKGNVSSFKAGKQSVGLKVFNDIIAISPSSFIDLINEEQMRKKYKDSMLEEAINGDSK